MFIFSKQVLNNYHKIKKLSTKKSVPQTVKISKPERISSKSTNLLEFAENIILWGTACEVLFYIRMF